MKLLHGALLIFLAFVGTVWAVTPKTVTIKNETKSFVMKIKYPKGFSDKAIDKAVAAFIAAKRKEFGQPENNLPPDRSGKDSLYIDYKQMFQNKNAVSLLFTVSTYTGGAHPNNTVTAFNFVQGKPISLAELFKPNTPYLSKLATLSRAALVKTKNNQDQKWLDEGTAATLKNYRNWYFTKDGLAIVFDTYQVAAYVYGPQTVKIAKPEFSEFLQPEMAKIVWGN